MNEPVQIALTLPDGASREVQLIAVLDQVADMFIDLDDAGDSCGLTRAADWFKAKYGTPA